MLCFQDMGYDTILHPGRPPRPQDMDSGDNLFLFDFPAFEIMGTGWEGDHHGWVVFYNVTTFGYNDESARHWGKHWRRWTSMYDGRIDALFDYDPSNCDGRYERDVPAFACGIGWHRSFQVREWGNDLHDVVFLGWVVKGGRRDQVIQPLEKEFNLVIHTRTSRLRQKNPNPLVHVSHEEDDRALRTRVFLHIKSSGANVSFCGPRIIQLGLSNMLFVLSEPILNSPLIDGKHWRMAPIEEWPELIRYYLHHSNERHKIEQAGHKFVKYNYRLQRHLEEAMKGAGLR